MPKEINRKQFWIAVAIVLALKAGGLIALELRPDLYGTLRSVDTGAFIALVFVVAARFKDIGWPRWWGIGFLILVSVVLPVVLVFTVMPPVSGSAPGDMLDAMGWWGWLSTALLLSFLVFVGTRPSRILAPDDALEPREDHA